MKLYRFYLGDNAIVREVLEVEEKPKTYTIIGRDWRQRIAKDDIGIVAHGRVHLLEDDPRKAVKILREYHIKNKIIHDKSYRRVVEDYNRTMAILEAGEQEATNE